MASHSAETNATSRRPTRWPLFLIGALLFLLGPALVAIQLKMGHQLRFPWHVPILASVGVLLMAASAWQRPGTLRRVGLVLFILLCGLEWFVILVRTRTPEYTGPAQTGTKIPTFATTLANGKIFTHKDLETGIPTVLLFFRGRW